jgi:hypothetical protein
LLFRHCDGEAEKRARNAREKLSAEPKPTPQGNLHHRVVGLRAQAYRRHFQSPPADVVAQRFARQRVKQAMKMKG